MTPEPPHSDLIWTRKRLNCGNLATGCVIPEADPNAVWTEITSRYMHIVPHPEISWWAQRVQLVTKPGFMLNYGLGAVVTADIRAHIRESLGRFDSGNPQWYAWVRAHLLRSGLQFESSQVLRKFFGRRVSLEPLHVGYAAHQNRSRRPVLTFRFSVRRGIT